MINTICQSKDPQAAHQLEGVAKANKACIDPMETLQRQKWKEVLKTCGSLQSSKPA